MSQSTFANNLQQSTAWYEKMRVKEDAINIELRNTRAHTYESMSAAEKKQLQVKVQSISEKLKALNKEIKRNRDEKFAQGSSGSWMSMIQKADDLQTANYVNEEDLKNKLNKK